MLSRERYPMSQLRLVGEPVFMTPGLRAKDNPKPISFDDLTSGYSHISLPMGT